MSEEIKNDQPEEVKQEAAAEAPKEEAAAEAPKEEVKEKTFKKVEIPMNCGECKKPIAKIRYYRNMQFFCNQKCWNKFKAKQAGKKAEAQTEAAE